MHDILDPFDPRGLDLDYQLRMYAGTDAAVECLVDEEDYRHFTQWLWVTKKSPCGKLYFRRAATVYGERRTVETVYLHVEICWRAHGEPPTRARCIVDHLNGNSLDNRRENLMWVTKRQNNRNRFGMAYKQRVLL